MNKNLLGKILFISLLLVSVTCAAAGNKLTKITMVLARSVEVLDDTHIHVASEMGYFKEEGLEVILQQSYGTTDVRMLGAGQADVAFPSPAVQLVAHGNNIPIKSFFAIDQRNIWAYAVLPNSGINSISDLKGKTISLGDAGWSQISNPLLRRAGVDPKDVEYVPAGENRAQLVWEGKIDAVLTWEKEYQLWQAQGMDFQIIYAADYFDTCASSIATNTKTIEKNPELLKRFGRAVAKGLYFCKLNPAAATEIVLEKFPSIRVDIKGALKAIEGLVYITNDDTTEKYGYGYHNKADWEINIEDSLIEGIISKPIPVEEVYTNEFVEFYNDFDHIKVEADAANYKLKPKYQVLAK